MGDEVIGGKYSTNKSENIPIMIVLIKEGNKNFNHSFFREISAKIRFIPIIEILKGMFNVFYRIFDKPETPPLTILFGA